MMRVFSYYAVHSFVNQIKKLFKTWFAILIAACLLIGVGLGLALSKLDDMSSATPDFPDEMSEPSGIGTGAEDDVSVTAGGLDLLLEQSGLEKPQFAEALCGAAVFALLCVFVVLSNKRENSVFLPADAGLLFPSPMSPQKIMLFRLMTQIGMMVFLTIYYFIEIPVLMDMGLDVPSAIAVIITLGMTFISGMLIQAWIFLFTSLRPAARKAIAYAPIVIIAAVFLIVFFYGKAKGLGLLPAALSMLSSKASRYVPVWGWIKALPFAVLEKDYLSAAILLLLDVLSIAALVRIISHTKCDYYEDALRNAEIAAEKLEKMKNSGSLFSRNSHGEDKKVRERKQLRFSGFGESVFFGKQMFIRRQEATAGIFTKSGFFYLAVGALVIFIGLMTSLPPYMLLTIASLAMGAVAFFKTLSNPLISDIKTDYFRLTPGNPWKKMFWSVLAGSVNCILDILPAMLVCTAVSAGMGADLKSLALLFLCGILLTASLDFYSSNVGAFIQLSLPSSAGTNLKQVVQVLFLYFGLIPDILIIAFLAISDASLALIAVVASAVNMLMGFFFMAFAPLFLWPSSKSLKDGGQVLAPDECAAPRKSFSRAGIAVFAALAGAAAVQFAASFLMASAAPEFASSDAAFWMLSFLPVYCIGIPAAYLILKKLPARALQKQNPGAGFILKSIIVMFCFGYTANILNTLITSFIYIFGGFENSNLVQILTQRGPEWVQVLVMVVVGPFFEELLFRKLLIDRLNIYGGRLAVVFSAICFGLFHGNIQQMLYAFAIGLVLGYVYQRTGNILYNWFLHALFNLNGGVIASKLIASENEKLMIAYEIFLLAMILAGIVIAAVNARSLKFVKAEKRIPRGHVLRTAYLNPGVLLMLAGCAALAVYNIAALAV